MFKNVANGLIYLPYLWAVSGIFWFNQHKVMSILVAISCLLYCYLNGYQHIRQNISRSWFLKLMLLSSGYAVFSYYYQGFSSREMRSLISCLILLAVVPIQINIKAKWFPYLLGCISIGSFAYILINVEILHISRGHWPTNAIPYATFCAVLALISLHCLLTINRKHERTVYLACSIINFSSVIYTQTRGVWLALFAAILALLWCYRSKITKNTTIILMTVVTISVLLLWPRIEGRYQQTAAEINQIHSGNLTSSIGLRWQMWSASLSLIADAPLLGHGDRHLDDLRKLNQQGKVDNSLIAYSPPHYHNQYLDKAVKGGIIGFMLLVLLLVIPALHLRGLSKPHSVLLLSLLILYGTAFLTDVALNHAQMVYLIFISIGIILNSQSSECKEITDNPC